MVFRKYSLGLLRTDRENCEMSYLQLQVVEKLKLIVTVQKFQDIGGLLHW